MSNTQLARLAWHAVFFAWMGSNVFAADAAAPDPPRWNVRVDALVVQVPQEKFLTLLPDLLDDAKIGNAVAELLDGVKRKEVILRGCPMVNILDEEQAISETIQLLRTTRPWIFAGSLLTWDYNDFVPVTYTPRNRGVSMQVEPLVTENGKWVDLNLRLFDVDVPGDEDAKPGPKINPRLITRMEISSETLLSNGQYALVGVHRISKPEGYMEVFIVRAVAKLAK